jgi:threonine/homoserine/homoserine lactone efflux protein
MSLESTVLYALALLLAAASPGPGVVACVACAMARGAARGMAMAAGHALGDICFVLLAVYGLTLLATALGELFLIVKLAGAAYLVWLGVKLWRAKPQPARLAPPADARGLAQSFAAGLAVALGNPKMIAFYLGFLPSFVDVARLAGRDVVTLTLLTWLLVTAVMGGYALAAGRARRLLGDPRRVGLLNRLAGCAVIGAGVAVAGR